MVTGSPDLIRQYGVEALWYLCPLAQVESILRLGILCHNRAHAEGLVVERIDDPNVQDRRGLAMCGKKQFHLHDCANLFFAKHTPMLWHAVNVQRKGPTTAHVQVDPGILTEDGVFFSDGNCAADETDIYDNLHMLERLNWEAIRARSFRNGDWPAVPDPYTGEPRANPTYKRCKSAEVLVPKRVSPEWFVAANLVFAGLAMILLRDIMRSPWLPYVPIAVVVMLFYSMDNASLTLLFMTASAGPD